jgi:hypothetical protein
MARIGHFPVPRMPTTIAIAPFALLIALAASPCHGQTASPERQDPFGRGGMVAPEETAGAEERAPKARQSSAALREGVLLNSVPGYFARSLRHPGLLVFRFEDGASASVRRSLIAMPCDPVDDVKAIIDDPRADSPSRFEVSGEVYEFGGDAYLLPVAVVALRTQPPPGMLARIAPRELQPPPAPGEGPRAPRTDAYADRAAVEMQATPVRDVPHDHLAHEPNPAMFPGLDDGLAEQLERRLDAGIASSGTGTGIKRATEPGERRFLLPAGTRFQDRRASVLRDPVTGAWRARFDTGRAGEGSADGAESSVELLPSRTLEKLARSVRQSAVGSAWLLSGEVVVSRDRNYLLLTRAVPNPKHRFLSP